jgi:hypothetical protein
MRKIWDDYRHVQSDISFSDFILKNGKNYTISELYEEAKVWEGYYRNILIEAAVEVNREQLLKYWTEV